MTIHEGQLSGLECDAGVSFKELHRTQREMIQAEMDGEQAKHELIETNLRLVVSIVFPKNALLRSHAALELPISADTQWWGL